jgi:hypothetical protein
LLLERDFVRAIALLLERDFVRAIALLLERVYPPTNHPGRRRRSGDQVWNSVFWSPALASVGRGGVWSRLPPVQSSFPRRREPRNAAAQRRPVDWIRVFAGKTAQPPTSTGGFLTRPPSNPNPSVPSASYGIRSGVHR